MRKGRSEKRHLSEKAASEFVARRGGSSFQISEVRETVGRHQQVLKRSRGKLKYLISIHANSIYSCIAMITTDHWTAFSGASRSTLRDPRNQLGSSRVLAVSSSGEVGVLAEA